MADLNGWISLHRKIQNSNNYFKEPFCRTMAWIDLLLLATYSSSHERIRGIRVKTERGQVSKSVTELAKRWQWSKGKVFRFLNELEIDSQISMQKNNVTTLISIINYDSYQRGEFANNDTKSPQNGTQTERRRNAEPYNCFEINHLQALNKDNKVNKEINNRGAGDLASPPNPASVSGFNYLPDGRSYIEPTKFFTSADFNGLPKIELEAILSLVEAVKGVKMDEDRVKQFWEVFKALELTFQKPYRNEQDVYRHFGNWVKKQPLSKGTKKPTVVSKKQKLIEPVVGVKFVNDFSECEMSDGSVVKLDVNQKDLAKYGQISPNSIKSK